MLLNMFANGSQLTEGREFNHKKIMEARNFNTAQDFLKSNKPLLLVRCCYAFGFLLTLTKL